MAFAVDCPHAVGSGGLRLLSYLGLFNKLLPSWGIDNP